MEHRLHCIVYVCVYVLLEQRYVSVEKETSLLNGLLYCTFIVLPLKCMPPFHGIAI